MQNTITSERLDDRLLRDIFLELVPGLPLAAASSLSSASKPKMYDAGDLIISEGEPNSGIFVLISGTARRKVSRRTSEVLKQINLPPIAAPAVLGLTSAILAQPSAVSIVALTPTETAFIPRAEFLRVLGQLPQVGLAFSRLIASELAHTYSHLTRLRGVAPRSADPSISAG